MAGSALCAQSWCTVSGEWHIAWHVPYNGLFVPLEQLNGMNAGFPTYMIAAFFVPLVYGAWRFVILHAITGPVLAHALTTNSNEMPAILGLFSIMILLVTLSPIIKGSITVTTWWVRQIEWPN